jgi:hypothetical protein
MPLRQSNTASLPATLAVTSSATLVLAGNTSRVSLLIVNTSPDTCYFGYDSTGLTTSTGVAVLANEALYEDIYTGPVYAIKAGATVNLPYIEVA